MKSMPDSHKDMLATLSLRDVLSHVSNINMCGYTECSHEIVCKACVFSSSASWDVDTFLEAWVKARGLTNS